MGTDGILSKPDPRLLQQACNALGISPSQTLVSLEILKPISNWLVSGAAGCIGVTGGWSTAFHLPADAVIYQLEEIEILSQ